MRTVELPDEVYDRATRAAAAKGISLAEYLEQRVEEDATVEEAASTSGYRANFPLIRSGKPGKLNITKEIIDGVELEDDLRRGGFLGYER